MATLSQAVIESQAWVVAGGHAVEDTVRPTKSEGELEVDYFPSPHPVQPKVLQSNQVQHKLDKGPWAATPAVWEGWKIFLGVSSLPASPPSS